MDIGWKPDDVSWKNSRTYPQRNSWDDLRCNKPAHFTADVSFPKGLSLKMDLVFMVS